jgi:hypothetical protein
MASIAASRRSGFAAADLLALRFVFGGADFTQFPAAEFAFGEFGFGFFAFFRGRGFLFFAPFFFAFGFGRFDGGQGARGRRFLSLGDGGAKEEGQREQGDQQLESHCLTCIGLRWPRL